MNRDAIRMLRNAAARLFDTLRDCSHTGVGISRDTFGVGESTAMAVVREAGDALGLQTWFDEMANLNIQWEGTRPELPVILCGSHLDSVHQGGNYDGAAGVVGGLLAIEVLRAEGWQPQRTIRVVALRGEESAWFGKCYLGSSGLFGQLTGEDLDGLRRKLVPSKPDGLECPTLAEAMRQSGVAVDRVRRGEVLLDPASVRAFVELHIEQGPVLVEKGCPLGVVTNIRGNHRYGHARCVGEGGHSGTVPRNLRHDPVFAFSRFIARIDEHWRKVLDQGYDLVVTAGVVHTDRSKNTTSLIPDEVEFSLEFRSTDLETLRRFDSLVREEMREIGNEKGVSFDLGLLIATPPASMSEEVLGCLFGGCTDANVRPEVMASGAGHDAAVFANVGVPSGMLFIRNANGSHNPRESMELDDFLLGVGALAHALRRLDVHNVASVGFSRSIEGSDIPRSSGPESKRLAQLLLQSGRISTRIGGTFRYSSGWNCPGFVDVKGIVSDVDARNEVVVALLNRLSDLPTVDAIAAGEVGSVPLASIVAERLGIPLLVVRSSAQGFGTTIMGEPRPGMRAIVVGDVTTDGRSKLKVACTLRRMGVDVEHVLVVFSHGFGSDLRLTQLVEWCDIIEAATERSMFDDDTLFELQRFVRDPRRWSSEHGGLGGSVGRTDTTH